jgi:hypothetical protein
VEPTTTNIGTFYHADTSSKEQKKGLESGKIPYMPSTNLIVQKPKSINWRKVENDLTFLRVFRDFARKENWRLVVSGGYGLDLFLGQITRNHRDIDVVIYGQRDRGNARKMLSKFIYSCSKNATVTIENSEYFLELAVKYPGFAGNLYYVQTKEDPFTDLHQVIKSNGESIRNSEARFPSPVLGKLDTLEIEVQEQRAHLADILYKKGSNLEPSKYDQDIENIKRATQA